MKRKKIPYQKTYSFLNSTQYYRVLGKGQKVVLLHGSMSLNLWGGFEKLLARHFQVFLPQMPGFGTSETINGQIHNTDLFAQAFGHFLKIKRLEKAPILALSLGTIVALKAAASGDTLGQLILIGMPGKIFGWMAKVGLKIPLSWRRALVATNWGKKNLLLPVLRTNTGTLKSQEAEKNLMKALKQIDCRALADPDHVQAIEVDLPQILPKVKNPMFFVYGELDKQRGAVGHLISDYTIVRGATHNAFESSQPKKTLSAIKKLIKN